MSKPLKAKDLQIGAKYNIQIIDNSYNLKSIKKEKRNEFITSINGEYIYTYRGFLKENKFILYIYLPDPFDSFSDTEFIIKFVRKVYKWDEEFNCLIKSINDINGEYNHHTYNFNKININCYIFEANTEYSDTEFILK